NEITLTYSGKDELARIIEIERIKELCFEGHRFFDITRRKQNLVRSPHTTSSVKKITYPSYKFVLPIPEREMGVNHNMQPNPGY
ncbi:MAG: RagB/SusD family nutrient uptake outer membrane protein, partial [Coprobacter sp.]|nr:RagB/SusD family nutrient uptake outer membrane protein [Coprobacter sp.]